MNDVNANIQIQQENEHTHEEDDELIGKNQTLNRLRDAIREDPTVPIKRVYDRVIRIMNRAGAVIGNIFPNSTENELP